MIRSLFHLTGLGSQALLLNDCLNCGCAISQYFNLSSRVDSRVAFLVPTLLTLSNREGDYSKRPLPHRVCHLLLIGSLPVSWASILMNQSPHYQRLLGGVQTLLGAGMAISFFTEVYTLKTEGQSTKTEEQRSEQVKEEVERKIALATTVLFCVLENYFGDRLDAPAFHSIFGGAVALYGAYFHLKKMTWESR